MRNSNSIMVFLLLAILSLCKANTLACNEKEKQALLRFKQALTDPANRLSSWSFTEDCCRWAGVRCDNVSGHVLELHLDNPYDLYAGMFKSRSALGGQLPHLSPNVMVLIMANNSFSGHISSFLGQKMNGRSKLEILDLSNNALSGELPHCLMQWQSLTHLNLGSNNLSDFDKYSEAILLVIKGRESEYERILPFVRIVDLSNNNLSGTIPIEISSLFGLQSLNLSQNHLTGRIPEKIGGVEYLESLDLSSNHLLGEIPQSITNLTFLSHLDLSYNNFSGRIPSSTQLQSFDAHDFIGNPELCGAPLLKNCTENEDPQGVNPNDENGEDFEKSWFYIGMATGFIVSFWGVSGAFLCKRVWRHAYFRFLDNMNNRVYVATV